MNGRVWTKVLLVMMAGGSSPLWACSVCFGKSDSRLAEGMNMGIFALLAVVTAVLLGIGGFFVFVARRSARLERAGEALVSDSELEPELTINRP